MAAIERLPLGTASALEFLGPLGVAVWRGRGGVKIWPAIAAVGVVCLTQPWTGEADAVGVAFALAAAVCWGVNIVLTQHVGDEVTGLKSLAVSMPVAALVATVVAGPSTIERLTPELVLIGLGLAILLPVVPFTLEFLALRRLAAAAFETLMSLEPALPGRDHHLQTLESADEAALTNAEQLVEERRAIVLNSVNPGRFSAQHGWNLAGPR
jgi:inner membrane transporter RhtA